MNHDAIMIQRRVCQVSLSSLREGGTHSVRVTAPKWVMGPSCQGGGVPAGHIEAHRQRARDTIVYYYILL